MTILKGTSISSGYAEGPAWQQKPASTHYRSKARIPFGEVDMQLRRLQESLAKSAVELKLLRDRTSSEIGTEQAAIFGVQIALLSDNQFITKVEELIRNKKWTAERALINIVEDWAAGSEPLTSEYLRKQTLDIRDLVQRLMSGLPGRLDNHPIHPPEKSILIAKELSPSDVIQLDRSRIAAVVTEWGGPTDHSSILLRSLAIPAVTGVTGIQDRVRQGQNLLVNAEFGTVIIEPSTKEATLFRNQRTRHQQFIESLNDNESQPCITLDGVQISISANISRPDEVTNTLIHNMEGVELLRTEFLFMSKEPPSLLDQYEIYTRAAKTLEGRPLVIRTFDFGGDKIPLFLQPWAQANPKLSLRGLSFSLQQEHLLRTQLLAILDAAQHYDIRILFPMVMSDDDLCAAIDLVKDIATVHSLPVPLLGAMIETPSVLFALDEVVPHVEFLSLGTNDLAQLMLGTDRNATQLSEEYAAVYPAILRAIRRIVEAAEKAGRPLTVCGEMAGHPTIASLLVGLGIRRLSMTPSYSAQVRCTLRNLNCKRAEKFAMEALKCSSRHQVKELLKHLSEHEPDTGAR